MNKEFSTTVRLTKEHKRFLDEKRKNEKGWKFSPWIEEKLDELMHKDSSFLRQKITQTHDNKTATIKRYEDELNKLQNELEEAEEIEKLRKQRLEQHQPRKRVYGNMTPKEKQEVDDK